MIRNHNLLFFLSGMHTKHLCDVNVLREYNINCDVKNDKQLFPFMRIIKYYNYLVRCVYVLDLVLLAIIILCLSCAA